jgi:excinuclease ABC subunit C
VDRIPGIGAVRRKALLTFFGDVKRIRSASAEDLQRVEGIGTETASRILAFLGAGDSSGSGTGESGAAGSQAKRESH